MKKTLILLAGYPGTGKSYMANIIIKNFPELRLLSPDDIKEKFWDKYGFDTLEQKEELMKKKRELAICEKKIDTMMKWNKIFYMGKV